MQSIDYNNIKFHLTSQFHVLLHFSGIDQRYQDMLLENGFTHEQIEQQLKEDRSKFDSNFAYSPDELWQKLAQQIEKNNYQLISNQNKKVLKFSFGDESVGEDNLYRLPEPVMYENSIDTRIIKINGTPIETNQINCILRPEGDQYKVLTIFPGVYAPPF
ncbi:MAG: hypothetical protein C0599_01915, partial [Salinivirgaceae bacterium]